MRATLALDVTGRTHRDIGPLDERSPFDVVFLDRDGTLNVLAPGYRTTDDLALLPGAAEAAAALSRAGARLVIVTNQRGIARGLLTWEQLEAVNRSVIDAVGACGGSIDDVRVCPHEAGECRCRKPHPGLLTAFFEENPRVRRDRCVMVGDADSDAAAARAAGVRFVRVRPDVGLAEALDSLLGAEPGTIHCRS